MSNTSNNAVAIPGSTAVRQMLQHQQHYPLADLRDKNRPMEVRCSGVSQRNWSRVATGQYQDRHTADQARLFLKQYVDRAGEWNEKLWSYERTGVEIAQEVLAQHIGIPRLVASDEALLINAFEYAEILSMDELLRADTPAFERAYPVALESMVEVLEVLRDPDLAERYELPQKSRDYGNGALCLNFKGFELRNMGVKTAIQGTPRQAVFFLFDFGRPYLAPLQEAAAKLFVSIGLLNWGRPLSRFSKGPDLDLLQVAKQQFLPYLDRQAVEAELRLQRSFRWAEIQGTGSFERSIKRLAISTLGGRYLHRLENWCRSTLR